MKWIRRYIGFHNISELAARLQARRELYEQVFQLFEQGFGSEQIAELTGKSRRTIFRWIREDRSPVRIRNRPSRLAPYRELINQWCRDGQYNVIQLWEELQKQGYRGSSMAVRRYLHRHHFPAPTGRRRAVKIKLEAETAIKPVIPLISPRAAVLKLLHADQLKEEEQPLINEILKSSPEIEKAVELGREFENLLMGRDQTPLDDWLSKAQASAIREIKSFARGLVQDKSAIQAAIQYEWSQGQVEGQVNRLKLIKRQMYGRANFDLLKARVTHQA